jgi:hypothetical protein
MRYSSLITTLLVSLCLSIGCGRKAAPSAPEVRAPRAVVDLDVKGVLEGVYFSWKAPSKNAKGEKLFDLVSFELKRRIVDTASGSKRFDSVASIELGEQDLLRISKGETVDTEFTFLDRNVEAGAQYDYILVPVNDSGVEGVSDSLVRVSFVGESSVIEKLPF